jgi:hypothetical protein
VSGCGTDDITRLANGAFSWEQAEHILLQEAARQGKICMNCRGLLDAGAGEPYNAPDEADDFRTCAACVRAREGQ